MSMAAFQPSNSVVGSVAHDQQQREAYCPVCDQETVVEITVPWQDDICTNCRNSIPESGDA